jgi:hypothetical protein
MLDLAATYQRLARPWTDEPLAAHYQEANRRRERMLGSDEHDTIHGPITLLATSVPHSTSLSVAVHVLHVLPSTPRGELQHQLVDTIDKNATAALHLCHRALELDGQAHQYTTDEWLPAVYDTAAQLLEAARLDREPASVVQYAQEAISWLAQAIMSLDQDAPDAPAAITDALGRLLTVYVFSDIARNRVHSLDDERV